MYRLNYLFTKYSKSVPLVASIPAIIAGNDWYEYIRHNNTTKSHTNSSFKPSLTLRSARLEDTATADQMSQLFGQWLPSVVRIHIPGESGTGFVVSESGLIVTNCHVVADHRNVTIKLNEPIRRSQLVYGGNDDNVDEVPAHVIYCHPDLDVAVVRVYWSPDAIPALQLTDRTDIAPGEHVMPIGNPVLPLSGSYNVVNATYEVSVPEVLEVRQIEHWASAVAGYSGGPVLDRDGHVVGVTYSGNTITSHAILSADIKRVLDKAVKFETEYRRQCYSMADKKSLGVILERITFGFVVMGFAINVKHQGLCINDMIVAINGSPLKTYTQLEKEIQSLRNDHELSLEVYRQGVEGSLHIKVVPQNVDHFNCSRF